MAAAVPFRTEPEVHRVVVTGDHALVHFTMRLVAERGQVGALEVFETFALNGEGKICHLGPYWDMSCVTEGAG